MRRPGSQREPGEASGPPPSGQFYALNPWILRVESKIPPMHFNCFSNT